jgi:hypothetical protein
MLLVKSNIFGTILNTQNMQETNRYLTNLYMKRSRDPTSEPPSPQPWYGSRPVVGNHWRNYWRVSLEIGALKI